jgi:hypothetical protein
MLALLLGGQVERDPAPLHAAARCLMRQQLATGDWPQQHISGVFNRNCMITYANYRCVSPPCGACAPYKLMGVPTHVYPPALTDERLGVVAETSSRCGRWVNTRARFPLPEALEGIMRRCDSPSSCTAGLLRSRCKHSISRAAHQ